MPLTACQNEDDGFAGDDDAQTGDDDDYVPLPPCEQYLACVSAVDPGVLDEQTSLYGPDGTCWDSEDAAVCEQACLDARFYYEIDHAAVDACWDGENPNTFHLFGSSCDWEWTVGSCYLSYPINYASTHFRATTAGGPEQQFTFLGSFADGENAWSFNTQCEVDIREFVCEQQEADDSPEVWMFSGTFAEDYRTADWLLTVHYNDYEYTCNFIGQQMN